MRRKVFTLNSSSSSSLDSRRNVPIKRKLFAAHIHGLNTWFASPLEDINQKEQLWRHVYRDAVVDPWMEKAANGIFGSFAMNYTEGKRKRLGISLRKNYHGCCLVVVEKGLNFLERWLFIPQRTQQSKKWLVAKEMKFGKLVSLLNKDKYKEGPYVKPTYYLNNKIHPPKESVIQLLDEQYKRDDGFIYISCVESNKVTLHHLINSNSTKLKIIMILGVLLLLGLVFTFSSLHDKLVFS